MVLSRPFKTSPPKKAFHCKLNQRKDVYHVFAHYFQLTQMVFVMLYFKTSNTCSVAFGTHTHAHTHLAIEWWHNFYGKLFRLSFCYSILCYCDNNSSDSGGKQKQHNLFSSIWIKTHLRWLHVTKSTIPLYQTINMFVIVEAAHELFFCENLRTDTHTLVVFYNFHIVNETPNVFCKCFMFISV